MTALANATILQSFEEWESFEVPWVVQSDRDPRGAIKWNLPRNEVRVAEWGYILRWGNASPAQALAVLQLYELYGGHTAFAWVPPPLEVTPTLWLFDAVPAVSGIEPARIEVRIVPHV